ncbi:MULTISPECIES: penicillin-binding transpeptidase domain-containing protein [unclassified Paenibacillus]|uniref:penicillin-binding transpeptidase domain-containing protein n=1 Tax=unclassified Paenibacillus TaxID=185978 RepID=UPI002404D3CF|nr:MULTISPECIES: penicillin-binding transpeptidase domain-containing protein [unclassified Paenibacillus]MDF9843220.1 penicillin-binding protein 2B [Paenibacillus sp. PastF-2]MDF9849808.1 penicillin-binding protein 2B [Paenibacillus sp. PastM-2]MDF9856515.1 penicillin-binding protein 2B [Paenibacillus sp. PastF-1]MDH6481785.1 penicillin-binding protein 2B [Paenibacillus sp. PastH-2]MDH6509125.1 penicillin-binding protein 2B [Paenibacillus sp. PastM-3]
MVKRIKLRTLFIGGCITLFFLVLVVRVFWIQVMQNDFWHEKAVSQWAHTSVIKAKRGTIEDRNGSVMASDVPAYTVVVNPQVIAEKGFGEEVIKGLHDLLGKPEAELKKLVEAKDDSGNYLKNREIRNEGWKIDKELADKVREFNKELEEKYSTLETGIGLITEQKRYYPKDSLAAHILGYTNRDGEAIMGLESYFNKQLQGTNGKLYYQSDGKGIKLPDSNDTYQPAVNGSNIKLTIDSTIQRYIQEAMQKAYDQYKPKSMTVIAADPNTMEILGLANLPTFNPNEFWKYAGDQENFLNHAIKSIYEPGSTFKIVTLAGAVEENLFNPEATFKSGSIRIKGYSQPLHDINRAGWGEISFLEGVKRSSNVAFVKLGFEMLGQDRLMQYIHDFGFEEQTGIDLPGEVSGRVTPKYSVEYATLAYGHGKVQVTPIEQLTAVAAIANGGKLMVPHVIKEISDPNTGETSVTKPEVVRQVISEESARETGSYLEQVVSDQSIGTGKHAYIEGYRVAGKTGTAIKVEGQDYVKSKVLVSFIGYAPVNDPKIAVIVIIDEPNVEVGGGTAAAPVFKEIVSQSLQYMGVPKTALATGASTKINKTAPVQRSTPDLEGKTVKEARELLLDQGYDFEAVGSGNSVVSQYPEAGTLLASGQRIYLLSQQGDQASIPDLKGQSLRDALEVLNLLKVQISVEGEGYVTEQTESSQNGKKLVQLKLSPLNEYGEDIPVAAAGEQTEDSGGSGE